MTNADTFRLKITDDYDDAKIRYFQMDENLDAGQQTVTITTGPLII